MFPKRTLFTEFFQPGYDPVPANGNKYVKEAGASCLAGDNCSGTVYKNTRLDIKFIRQFPDNPFGILFIKIRQVFKAFSK